MHLELLRYPYIQISLVLFWTIIHTLGQTKDASCVMVKGGRYCVGLGTLLRHKELDKLTLLTRTMTSSR